MSDEPLFKNADAQEAAYAPEGSDTDHGVISDAVDGPGIVIPAAGLATMNGNAGGTTGVTGVPAAGPALAGAALAGDTAPEGAVERDRDRPEGINDADAQTPSG